MQFLDQHILLALIALPMVGAAVIMAIPGAHDNSVRRVATAFGTGRDAAFVLPVRTLLL